MRISPAVRTSQDPIFQRMPSLGFEIGSNPEDKVHFVFWRRDPAYDDWQDIRRIVDFDMANGRIVAQNMRNGEYELTTGAWFRSMADYQRFLTLSQTRGTLRMNADFTMHRDLSRTLARRVTHILERAYAEFDNVRVTDIRDQTFDNDGGVRCMVTYRRPYVAPDEVTP